MVVYINRSVLGSSAKFAEAVGNFTQEVADLIRSQAGVDLSTESVADLLLASSRLNEYDCVVPANRRRILSFDAVKRWVVEKLCPIMVSLPLSDPDILRLLIFCIEITEQMFEGGSRATISAKGFRERQRRYEEILITQFIGKLGEVLLKRYLENLFPNANIELDWDISPDRQRYESDIPNAIHRVSIKSSPSLAGIWAEGDLECEYAVMVKCIVPRATLLQFFIEVCGYTRLLDFAAQHIPTEDVRFQNYLQNVRERVRQYTCGSIQTHLTGIISGYFVAKEHVPVEEGEDLEYLGKVREKRYLVKLNELRWTRDDWLRFLADNGLLTS